MEDLKTKMDSIYASYFSHEDCIKGGGLCPCFKECVESIRKKDCRDLDAVINNEHSFCANYNARIGKNFGMLGIPKIVFIGKESTHRSNHTEYPANFREQKNQHYRRTRATLAALLGITDVVDEQNQDAYSFVLPGSKNEYDLHTLFAFTNHYHCAFKKTEKVHGVPTTDVMWHNCTRIVKAELEVLRPDIIVIQSGWSTKKHAEKYIKEYFPDIFEVKCDPDCNGLYWLENVHTQVRECCIIGSYHPSFHCWHQANYLNPLNERIKKARVWFDSKYRS